MKEKVLLCIVVLHNKAAWTSKDDAAEMREQVMSLKELLTRNLELQEKKYDAQFMAVISLAAMVELIHQMVENDAC